MVSVMQGFSCLYRNTMSLIYDAPLLSPECYMMPWDSYQIRKIAGCACAGNAGNVVPTCRLRRKPLVSDPGMHHGTCVTRMHNPQFYVSGKNLMASYNILVTIKVSGSLTCGGAENVPGIPGAYAPAILRIWQEAHSVDEGLHYRTQGAFMVFIWCLN